MPFSLLHGPNYVKVFMHKEKAEGHPTALFLSPVLPEGQYQSSQQHALGGVQQCIHQ